MIHVNSSTSVTLDKLARLKVTTPKEAGRYWQPIRHIDLVTALHEEIEWRKWTHVKDVLSLSATGSELAGVIHLRHPEISIPGVELCLGFLNSNSLRRRLKIAVGGNVMVCHNGVVTGEVLLQHRHTINFDLKDEIREALDGYQKQAKGVLGVIKRWQEKEIKQSTVDSILMEVARERVLPWSHVGLVDHEYRFPRHKDPTFQARTSWALLMAFTEVVKKSPPLVQMDRISRFRELLPR
jgi:hypothetical protein